MFCRLVNKHALTLDFGVGVAQFDKAAGIDKVTKKQYGMNLDQNLTRLVSK